MATAATTSAGNPINTNTGNSNPNNPNPFGSSGPTPVIPAFVLSGVLLIVLVSICTWRRMLATRSQSGLVARYGPFGITFVPATTTMMEGGGGMRGRAEERVVLGPKPELWDAYTRRGEKHGSEVDEHTWKDMKPLSLSLGRSSASDGDCESPTEATSHRQPYLMRKVLRLNDKRSERKADPVPPPPGGNNIAHDVEVSVLIRMPSPTRPRSRRLSSDHMKEKERADFYYEDANDGDDDEFDYSLGVATVPLVVTEGNGAGR